MTLHPGGCGSLWRLLLYRYVVGEDDLLRDASWVSAIGSAAEAADPKVWRVEDAVLTRHATWSGILASGQ